MEGKNQRRTGTRAKNKVLYTRCKSGLKNELKTMYPFLSEDQISRKAKEKWKKVEKMGTISDNYVLVPKEMVRNKATFGRKDSKINVKGNSRSPGDSNFSIDDTLYSKGDMIESSTEFAAPDCNKIEGTCTATGNFKSWDASDDDSDDNILIRRDDTEFTTDPYEDSQMDMVTIENTTELGDGKVQKRKKMLESREDNDTELCEPIKKSKLYEFEINSSKRQMDCLDSELSQRKKDRKKEYKESELSQRKKDRKKEYKESVLSQRKKDRKKEYKESVLSQRKKDRKKEYKESELSQCKNDRKKEYKESREAKLLASLGSVSIPHTEDSMIVSQQTPALPSKDLDVEKITPQIDEVGKPTLLNKVNEAPKKKKRKHASKEKKKRKHKSESKAIRWTTKALRSLALIEQEGDKQFVQDVESKTGINKSVDHIIQKNTADLNLENAILVDTAAIGKMNPSGDAFENVFESDGGSKLNSGEDKDCCMDAAEKIDKTYEQDAVNGTRNRNPSQSTESDFRDFRSKKTEWFQADAWNSCSPQSCSSYSSCVESKENVNPALLQSIHNLRMCVPVTDQHSDLSQQIGCSSPGLLSPALSGMSLIMSSNSSEAEDIDSMMAGKHTGNLKTKPSDIDLCQLFKDVTPPEKKTSGEYKTKRMLASELGNGSDTFKQLFEHDEDILFS